MILTFHNVFNGSITVTLTLVNPSPSSLSKYKKKNLHTMFTIPVVSKQSKTAMGKYLLVG